MSDKPAAVRERRFSNAQVAKFMCMALAVLLILSGFVIESPERILAGLRVYVSCHDVLITDYFVVGSVGAALVNSGLVTLIAIALINFFKAPYTGSTISAVFLMAGFALFGKNPVNILPFFLGTWIYSKVKHQPMHRYINAALFSTALSPVVSYALTFPAPHRIINLAAGILSGAAIGYIIVPLSERSFPLHMGYSHFNIGFSCGLVALVIASVLSAVGRPIKTVMIWQSGISVPVLAFLLVLIVALLIAGLYFSHFNLRACLRIMRHSGRSPTDFVITDGIGVTMFNMGIMGIVSLGYVLLLGGDLSGPVVGAIFTAIGFSASGQHPKNSIPIMVGVWLASLVMIPSSIDPGMLLAALFGISLAPIAGQFGPVYGVIAGFLHAAVVLVTGAPCGGLNLYNNGFSAGLIALVMLSLIQGISVRWRHTDG